jgi:hypothetical protein
MSGQARHSREDLRKLAFYSARALESADDSRRIIDSLSDEEAEIPETEADREARFYSTRDSRAFTLTDLFKSFVVG